MDLTLQPSPFLGVGVSSEDLAMSTLLKEYEDLVKKMGTCCMTAEHYEHAQDVIKAAKLALSWTAQSKKEQRT